MEVISKIPPVPITINADGGKQNNNTVAVIFEENFERKTLQKGNPDITFPSSE